MTDETTERKPERIFHTVASKVTTKYPADFIFRDDDGNKITPPAMDGIPAAAPHIAQNDESIMLAQVVVHRDLVEEHIHNNGEVDFMGYRFVITGFVYDEDCCYVNLERPVGDGSE